MPSQLPVHGAVLQKQHLQLLHQHQEANRINRFVPADRRLVPSFQESSATGTRTTLIWTTSVSQIDRHHQQRAQLRVQAHRQVQQQVQHRVQQSDQDSSNSTTGKGHA